MISEATREYNKRYREANKDKLREQRKEYRKKYYLSNREKILSSGKDYSQKYRTTSKYKAHMRDYMKEYSSQHPEHLAHGEVYRALKKGILVKSPCEICGKLEVEAHHKDYNYPLDVSWLCKKHHTEWHRKNKPIYAK